jgi:hypothetical protein
MISTLQRTFSYTVREKTKGKVNNEYETGTSLCYIIQCVGYLPASLRPKGNAMGATKNSQRKEMKAATVFWVLSSSSESCHYSGYLGM